jgi:DnaK suppressor protein
MSAELKTYQTDSREVLREMLIRLQDETYQRIKDLRRDQQQESESGPADEMDSARTTAEVETHAGLIARAEEKLKFLDEALARLDAGKYGRCLGCRELIPFERLKALPFAAYCVDCQEKRNRARRGWGEGTIIPPYDHQWTVPEEMEESKSEGREYHSTDPEEQLTVDRGAIGSGEPEFQAKRATSPKKRISRRKR